MWFDGSHIFIAIEGLLLENTGVMGLLESVVNC